MGAGKHGGRETVVRIYYMREESMKSLFSIKESINY